MLQDWKVSGARNAIEFFQHIEPGLVADCSHQTGKTSEQKSTWLLRRSYEAVISVLRSLPLTVGELSRLLILFCFPLIRIG